MKKLLSFLLAIVCLCASACVIPAGSNASAITADDAGEVLELEEEDAEAFAEAILEAKAQAIEIKNETEAELKERRKELSNQERRIAKKEEILDAKTESLEKKEQSLAHAFLCRT